MAADKTKFIARFNLKEDTILLKVTTEGTYEVISYKRSRIRAGDNLESLIDVKALLYLDCMISLPPAVARIFFKPV